METETINVCSGTDWEIEEVQSQIICHMSDQCRTGVYVEIGSFRGGSLNTFGSMMPRGSYLVALDNKTNDDLIRVSESLFSVGYNGTILEGDSHSEFIKRRLIEHLNGRSIDVLFIDGDHTVEGCTKDLEMYLPLVADGGMVIMHDCGFQNPAKPLRQQVQEVIKGLNQVWLEYSAGKKNLMIQEWCGYGIFWK